MKLEANAIAIFLFLISSVRLFTFWTDYLKYKLYVPLSKHPFYSELLFCVLCSGFWSAMLANFLVYLIFGTYWYNFFKLYMDSLVYFFVVFVLQLWGFLGAYSAFRISKIGTVFRTYNSMEKSFLVAVFVVLLPLVFHALENAVLFQISFSLVSSFAMAYFIYSQVKEFVNDDKEKKSNEE